MLHIRKFSSYHQLSVYYYVLIKKTITQLKWYLHETDIKINKQQVYPRGKHIDELLSLSDDVMVAGTLTVRNQTSWILLELLRNPAAMKKVEEDIKSVFPSLLLSTRSMLNF